MLVRPCNGAHAVGAAPAVAAHVPFIDKYARGQESEGAKRVTVVFSRQEGLFSTPIPGEVGKEQPIQR